MPKIKPLRAALGATVEGLDLSNGMDETTRAVLRQGLLDYHVLVFPKAFLSNDEHKLLALVFGEIEPHVLPDEDKREAFHVDGHPEILMLDSEYVEKNPTNRWHTDATFREAPPMGSLLSMQTAAASGGDTMWANTRRAYETLSEPIRQLVNGLTATHGFPPLTQATHHPVVAVHPGTGKPNLYVDAGWTREIDGLSPGESEHLLELLRAHMVQPEFTMRWSWSDGDAAIWDNRCTMHYALRDYGSDPRLIHRITIAGDKPRGLAHVANADASNSRPLRSVKS